MDRDALVSTMKAMKSKAKAAKKAGRPEMAQAFAKGSARVLRKLKRLKPAVTPPSKP